MRVIKPIIFAGLLLFFFSGNSIISYSQNFQKSLRSKLSKDDQRKISKSLKLMAKGYAIVGSDPFVPVPTNKESHSFYIPKDHQIAAYYLSHLDASLNFKFAIELKYEVLSKNIQAFWKTYKGDKKDVEWVSRVENSAFDSLVKADQIRQEADVQLHIAEKIPMLKMAERIEENAEFRMEKILFICQNLPMDPIPEWLASNDTLDPLQFRPVVKSSTLKTILPDSLLNAGPLNDTSLYSLLHITEHEVDLFNDFLIDKFPNQVESYVMDYEQMKQSKIDSLQEQWNKFVLGQAVSSDTSLSYAASRKNSPVQSLIQLLKDARNKRKLAKKSTGQTDSMSVKATIRNVPSLTENSKAVNKTTPVELPYFFYRVQIAACRVEISPQELKRRYNGPQKVDVTYEDDWYKYFIGSFNSYKSAKDLRDESGVKVAYVAAYLNGKRIKPYLISKKHP